MTKVIIGIDPDLNKSGVAVAVGGVISKLWCLDIVELFKYLDENKGEIKRVYLEAGWLNKKSSWHAAPNAASREKTAYKVGQNHAVGLKIEDMLKHTEIDYELIRPTEAKRNHDEFCILTKWDKRILTNPEKRDAGMLIVGIK